VCHVDYRGQLMCLVSKTNYIQKGEKKKLFTNHIQPEIKCKNNRVKCYFLFNAYVY
jgi:hypothetical protein